MRRSFVVLLVLAGCADGSPEGGVQSARADEPISVMGIPLDADSAAVRARLGAPVRHESPASEAAGDTLLVWHYPAATIGFAGNRVADLWCYGSNCTSGRGVGVGDSAAAVVRSYPDGKRVEAGGDAWIDVPGGQPNCGLTFHLVAERVAHIRLACNHGRG